MTPWIWSKSDSVHQKQPPAKTAAAVTSPLACGPGALAERCAQTLTPTTATMTTSKRASSLRMDRSSAARRREAQGGAVHAPALAGRRRAVVEHVAEMPAAAPAMSLGAGHEQGVVGPGADCAGDRPDEARPAGAAVKLVLRAEDRETAAGAEEMAAAMLLVERAAAGALGALLAQHPELLGAQPAAPLLRRQIDLERLRRRLGPAAEQDRAEGGHGRGARAAKESSLVHSHRLASCCCDANSAGAAPRLHPAASSRKAEARHTWGRRLRWTIERADGAGPADGISCAWRWSDDEDWPGVRIADSGRFRACHHRIAPGRAGDELRAAARDRPRRRRGRRADLLSTVRARPGGRLLPSWRTGLELLRQWRIHARTGARPKRDHVRPARQRRVAGRHRSDTTRGRGPCPRPRGAAAAFRHPADEPDRTFLGLGPGDALRRAISAARAANAAA